MKALSIKQPWAELILCGKKKIEIRSWNTKFRGYFLIHASKNPDREAMKLYKSDLEDIMLGYIIGYAKLVDVVTYNATDEFLNDKNKHLSLSAEENYPIYGFILEDAHRIKPIKYKGKLGFFEVREISTKDLEKSYK